VVAGHSLLPRPGDRIRALPAERYPSICIQRAVFQSSELADVLTERYFCSASREMR
jgi:hypothetical protein